MTNLIPGKDIQDPELYESPPLPLNTEFTVNNPTRKSGRDKFTYSWAIYQGIMPPNLTVADARTWGSGRLQNSYNRVILPDLYGGGSSGGGGGRAAAPAPVYVGPDEAAVRDQVKAYVVATTGTARPDLIDRATSALLAADKTNFDRQVAGTAGNQIDPAQAMKDVVRSSAEYETIHSLRPDSVDEMEWVVGRQQALRQIGLSSQRAETLGIKQAQVDANNEALVDAAEMQFNADTGRLLRSQRERLKQSAVAAVSLV